MDEAKETAVPERPGKAVRRGTQAILLVGFGGIIAMMVLAGLDSIVVLRMVQNRNLEIRQSFLLQNRALQDIRSSLDRSGTLARDYLLERDLGRAEAQRADLQAARQQMDAALATYSRSLRPAQAASFAALEAQIGAYWKVLDPIFHWTARDKQTRSEAFLHEELFPRRATTLDIADRIGEVNERELTAGDEQLAGIFDRSRNRLTAVLAISLTLGLALAGGATRYLVRLADRADVRFQKITGAQRLLRDLSARLLEVQEQERRSIARELHDEVGQSLSAVLMEIGNIAALAPPDMELRLHLESIKKLAENSVNVVRNMSLLLRPSMLDDLGLVPALQWQAREVSKRSGLPVDVTADNVADDLPEGHRTCIYRVVQEALHNCSRHAAAQSAQVVVLQQPEKIVLTVKDDGRGFDSRTVRGMGLLGMEERVTHLGGSFQVWSEPGKGTQLRIELPLAGVTT